MKKSGSDRGRPAFTLLEVALAGVAGSVLFASGLYSFSEGQRAVQTVYHELMVQNVARDLQQSLDAHLPASVAGASSALQLELLSPDASSADFGLGDLRLRWRDGTDAASTTGGQLSVSLDAGATFMPAIGLGARGMLDQTVFGYREYETELEASPPETGFTAYIDPRVRESLLRVLARLTRDGNVPVYLQAVWAPRVVNWSHLDQLSPTPGPGDSDGDGVSDAGDRYPWDPGRNTNGVGNFLPIVFSETSVDATALGASVNVFEGGGSGNFGWVTWDGSGSAPALAGMLTNPGAYTYINPNNPADNSLELGDWVSGNTGISNAASVRNALDTHLGQEGIVLVWNAFEGEGSGAAYRTAGYARVVLTGYHLPSKNITATFLGRCDREGNLLPGVSNGEAPGVVTAPSPEILTEVTVAPSPSPTPLDSPTPTPEPTETPSDSPSSTPSPSAEPTSTPTPEPTPPPSDEVYGVMIKDAVFAGRATGYETGNLKSGDSTWRHCNWNGSTAVSDWAARFTFPGNSGTYVNPLSATDTHLDVGDPITKFNNCDNNAALIAPLSDVRDEGRTVVVPLFSGISSGRATISGFANVQLISFALNGTDKMKFRFLGTCRSDGSAL